MAFERANLGRSTASYNTASVFTYTSDVDDKATIAGADYFVSQVDTLKVNDWILAVGTDGGTILVVATVDKATPALTVTVLV